MADTDVVTKGFLKRELKKTRSDFIDFMDTSVIPLLEKMDKKFDKFDQTIKEVKAIVDSHERRLDRHDDKFLIHDRLMQKLAA